MVSLRRVEEIDPCRSLKVSHIDDLCTTRTTLKTGLVKMDDKGDEEVHFNVKMNPSWPCRCFVCPAYVPKKAFHSPEIIHISPFKFPKRLCEGRRHQPKWNRLFHTTFQFMFIKRSKDSEKTIWCCNILDTEINCKAATLVDCNVCIAATTRKYTINWTELNGYRSGLRSDQDIVARERTFGRNVDSPSPFLVSLFCSHKGGKKSDFFANRNMWHLIVCGFLPGLGLAELVAAIIIKEKIFNKNLMKGFHLWQVCQPTNKDFVNYIPDKKTKKKRIQ